jgi:hypothetical protein
MIQPCLEVPGRRLDNEGGSESFILHFLDCRGRKVVHQAKVMLAFGADINVATVGVLVGEPRNGPE